ncbi:hypothetical protein TRFO_30360 [Tritrichomonas foetus]|uniref:Uncharacterized protein n=1 Tax=Tritrichomonas foetus TaxID=1144522 RepID=A0A1J4JYY4_9EUKA|nr:hypothetical protein TRFO_30360 [Tritrichomonas foetus]|eukprot:OHT02477.1 hypothetical protein TRFO_30360 [Tritrichomonas foetus]
MNELRCSSPLHLACEAGNSKILNYLLQCHIKDLVGDRESLDEHSKTPLICACQNGSLKCVEYLVKYGVKLDKSGRKYVPLIEAAAAGFVDIVAYLLKCRGVKIDRRNSQNVTATMAATAYVHCDIVELLLKNKAIKKHNNQEIGELFLLACGKLNMKLIEIIDKNIEVPYSTLSEPPTHYGEYRHRVHFYSNHDYTWGDKFMQQACILENIELCQFLLKKNVNFNKVNFAMNVQSTWSPFMDFITQNGLDFAKIEGIPLISCAIASGNIKNIKVMVEKGVKLDKKIIEDRDFISHALNKPKYDILAYLLSFKPKLTISKFDFNRVVEAYQREKHNVKGSKVASQCLKIFELLLEYNTDSEQSSNFHEERIANAVQSSVSNNCMEIVEILDKQGVDFTKYNYSYDRLSFKDALPMLKFLESKGYKFENTSEYNKKAIPIKSVLNGAPEVIQFLLKYTKNEDILELNYGHGNIVDFCLDRNYHEIMLAVFNKLGHIVNPKYRNPQVLKKWILRSNLPELIEYVQ